MHSNNTVRSNPVLSGQVQSGWSCKKQIGDLILTCVKTDSFRPLTWFRSAIFIPNPNPIPNNSRFDPNDFSFNSLLSFRLPIWTYNYPCKNPIIFLISTSPIGSATMSRRDIMLVNDSVLITHLTSEFSMTALSADYALKCRHPTWQLGQPCLLLLHQLITSHNSWTTE